VAQLTSLRLAGWKSIRDAEIELRPLNVLIGANGAGKSNLVSFFKLTSEMMDGRFQEHVGTTGGAESLLHYGSKRTQVIDARFRFTAKEDKIVTVSVGFPPPATPCCSPKRSWSPSPMAPWKATSPWYTRIAALGSPPFKPRWPGRRHQSWSTTVRPRLRRSELSVSFLSTAARRRSLGWSWRNALGSTRPAPFALISTGG
jgi:AAA domain-containing protein